MRLYLPDGVHSDADASDVDDLCGSAKQTGEPYWDPDDLNVLVIPMDSEPTAAEQDAIERRLTTPPGVEGTLQARVMTAYADLQAFENQANVSNADVVRIVRLLCKVARGLIRLQLRQLDKTD